MDDRLVTQGYIMEDEDLLIVLLNIVMDVRRDLANNYNIKHGPNKNYAGLCDLAVNILYDKLLRYYDKYEIKISFNVIHGEQKHTPKIDSSCWDMEHTWASVKIMGVQFYVDPTSSQFKDLYDDIPDFYVSKKKPKWYYSDMNNPAYRGIFRNIEILEVPIIPWLQYNIWGRICDTYRSIKKLKY